MKRYWNTIGSILAIFIIVKNIIQKDWKQLIFVGGVIAVVSIYYAIKLSKEEKSEVLKNDEFLKLDDLILDKDVNKEIEENALTSVKEQKSENNPEIK